MDLSSNDFDSLQRLLRLKKYELPPPRYFNEFSGNVIAGIRAQARRSPRWWERFGFDLRPALTLGAGAAACGLLLATVASALDDSPVAQAALPFGGAALAIAPVEATAAPAVNSFIAAGREAARSIDPVMNTAGTMMTESWRAQIRPASYQFSH